MGRGGGGEDGVGEKKLLCDQRGATWQGGYGHLFVCIAWTRVY